MKNETALALLSALDELAAGYKQIAQKISAAEHFLIDPANGRLDAYAKYIRENLNPLLAGQVEPDKLTERIDTIQRLISDLRKELSQDHDA